MGRGKRRRVASVALVVLVGGLAVAASVYAGSVVATPISSDPYQNPESQHRTQLEPDSFGWGNTVVATFQTGRFFDGGSSNIGWATTTNAGRTWTTGMLPATTIYATPAGPWARISDPAVAYDPQDDVWMISTLAIDDSVSGAAVLTSRSTDGGLTWQNPVTTSLSSGTFYDKNWITCDTWAQSPYYGNCYQEWDDSRLTMSTLDRRRPDLGRAEVRGRQRYRRPAGRAVGRHCRRPIRGRRGDPRVPLRGRRQHVAVVSRGRERQRARRGRQPAHVAASLGRGRRRGQGLRRLAGLQLPQRVHVERHRLMSTSTDGVAWTTKVRIPIDPTNSGVDHFIPGSRSTSTTSGSSAHLALGYYYYPVASCNTSTCQLTVGFVSSTDGGATWTQPRKVAGPVSLSWIASTNQGVMVGDYMSTSFAGGNFAFPIFAVAKAKTGTTFDERMYSARFDVTQPGPRVPVRKDRIRFTKHNFVPDLELPPVP